MCRIWHAIIVNDATLWAAITLNSRVCGHLVSNPPRNDPQDEITARALSFYETCIRRSESALLKVTFDLDSFWSWDVECVSKRNLKGLLTLVMERAREHATRWREFVWKHQHSFFTTRDVLERLPQELPVLQQLTISDLYWGNPTKPDGLQFPVCPYLQTLTLIDFLDDDDDDGQKTTLFQGSEFLTVKALTLGNNGWIWTDVDLRHMANYQNIYTLTLFSVGEEIRGGCTITIPINVTLPRLRLLRLRGWIPNAVLSLIIPPENLTVVVGDFDKTGAFVDSIGSLFGTEIATKMTTLRLEWSFHVINQVVLSSVFELLANATCLEAVSLSPQVNVMLGNDLEEFKVNRGYSFLICTDWA